MAEPACPTLNFIHILGKKWTVPIIEELYLSRGGVHFNELQTAMVGITPRILSKELEELHAEAFIEKSTAKMGGISYTDYKLTKRGTQLAKLIKNAKELGICWYGIDPLCKNRKCSTCALLH